MTASKSNPDSLMAHSWSTEHEIAFLKRLGIGKYVNPSRASRDKLLEGYAMSMVREDGLARVNWGKIDKQKVREYLVKEMGA